MSAHFTESHMDIVELSRLQFAFTAMVHFLFVPLTLGLSILLAIMETVYVMTGKTIYREMTKFWGKLFNINFALGVTTGIAMEFQFGTNWNSMAMPVVTPRAKLMPNNLQIGRAHV